VECLSRRNEDFHKPQKLSQQLSDKNTSLNLVVVMSAVDWWKTQRHEALGCIFTEACPVDMAWKDSEKNGGLDTFERTA